MLENYLPVLVFIGIAVIMSLIPMALGLALGPRRRDEAKDSPYECGFEAFEDSRMQFDVRYYLVAILCSSYSTWRLPSCFPGRWPFGNSAWRDFCPWRCFW